jgi:hypothetical protein
MNIKKVIKTYVKNYYKISYNPFEKQIILHDEFESNKNYTIELGQQNKIKIILVWGKIEETTGIQYHHKQLQSEISQFFIELIRNKKTKDFFKILIEENLSVDFNLLEIIDEFPLLSD